VFVVGGGDGVSWFESVLRYNRGAGLSGGWQALAPLQVGSRQLVIVVCCVSYVQLPSFRSVSGNNNPKA
jgi:hypothetical protein